MSMATTLKQLVAEAKAAGIDLPHLAPMLLDAWNDNQPSIYNDAGMSHPDKNGFVRFRQLDEKRESYMEDGQLDAARALRYSYACYPGVSACEPGTFEQYSAATNLANATTFRGMGLGDWFLIHPAKEYKDAFGGAHFRLDMSVNLADVYPIPYLELHTGKPANRTPEECVAYMLAQAATYVR